MSHLVPEFDLDGFCSDPASAQSIISKNMPDDEVMELTWHNGQPVVQTQSQRLFRPPSHPTNAQPPPETASTAHHLFMQEDEMASWLHYPLDDDTSFDQHITDLLYHPLGPSAAPPPSSSARALPSPLPPPPPDPHRHRQLSHTQTRPPAHPSAVGVNFPQFSRLKARVPESGQSATSSNNKLRELTVVDSSDTLKSSLFPISSSAVKISVGESINDSDTIAGTSTAGGGRDSLSSMDAETYGCSGSGGSATDLMSPRPSDDRKRKAFESAEALAAESEDLDNESYDGEKQCRRTASGKRSRAAEVHNLSERKRRDKINEKMKALQDLIPRCTKTDKASMLEEAIEYMKSLQMQLQMMFMGYYGMVPMVYPGVQQYMPMPMGMGMNRPMVPFPMQAPGASSSLGPRFQIPAFQPPIPPSRPMSVQTNPVEPVGNVNHPSSANVYQQYFDAEQMPRQHVFFENPPPISTPSTSKASTSKEAEDNENHPSGTDMHYGRSK